MQHEGRPVKRIRPRGRATAGGKDRPADIATIGSVGRAVPTALFELFVRIGAVPANFERQYRLAPCALFENGLRPHQFQNEPSMAPREVAEGLGHRLEHHAARRESKGVRRGRTRALRVRFGDRFDPERLENARIVKKPRRTRRNRHFDGVKSPGFGLQIRSREHRVEVLHRAHGRLQTRPKEPALFRKRPRGTPGQKLRNLRPTDDEGPDVRVKERFVAHRRRKTTENAFVQSENPLGRGRGQNRTMRLVPGPVGNRPTQTRPGGTVFLIPPHAGLVEGLFDLAIPQSPLAPGRAGSASRRLGRRRKEFEHGGRGGKQRRHHRGARRGRAASPLESGIVLKGAPGANEHLQTLVCGGGSNAGALEKAREVPGRKAIGIDRNVGIAAQLGTEVGMVGVVHGRRAARTEKATVPLKRQALR